MSKKKTALFGRPVSTNISGTIPTSCKRYIRCLGAIEMSNVKLDNVNRKSAGFKKISPVDLFMIGEEFFQSTVGERMFQQPYDYA